MLNLLKIKQLRKVLTQDATHTLVKGLVVSHLNYCNGICACLPACRMNLLQQVQNAAAKLVLGWSNYASVTDALKHLHWLPLHLRVDHKTTVQVYKCLMGTVPLYMQNLLISWPTGRRGLWLEYQVYWLLVPFTNKQTFAKYSFNVNGPALWNALPNKLRATDDTEQFKAKPKTHLFNKF